MWPSYLDAAPPRCPRCHRDLVDVSLAHYQVKTFACDLDQMYLYIYPDGREEWAMQ